MTGDINGFQMILTIAGYFRKFKEISKKIERFYKILREFRESLEIKWN